MVIWLAGAMPRGGIPEMGGPKRGELHFEKPLSGHLKYRCITVAIGMRLRGE